ncbi:MAG: multicopper oxidase domain-containing protein [Ignavibacteriales bacterium]
MRGTVKRQAAIAVTLIAFVVVCSFLLSFQLSVSSSMIGDQANTLSEPLSAKLRNILLIANENVLRIAPNNDLYPGGLWHNAMTFNGTIPGPLITANQGDTLNITLKNEGKLAHSLNFHAGFGPNHALSGVVSAGENKTWTMKVNYPGAFLYQCDGDNLNGMWEHIADGMYGGIVVKPPNKGSANEFYIAFNEIYDTHAHPPFAATSQSPVANNNNISNNSSNNYTDTGSFDIQKFLARKPDVILTNGMAFRYISWIGTESRIVLNPDAEAFHVKAGELTRWYIFNAGPRNNIAFNFGAGLVKEATNFSSNYVGNNNGSDVSSDGALALGSSSPDIQDSQRHSYHSYDEVVSIPPGSGTIVEVTFPEAGTYFGNDHDVGSILYGSGFVVIAE